MNGDKTDKKFYELFEDKNISNVFKDIYDNSIKTRNQIMGLVQQLKGFVTNVETAVVVVPLIREYMEILVRNDEHLIKLADSAIRLLKEGNSLENDGRGILSDEEKRQLLNETKEYEEAKKTEDEKKKTIDEKVEEIKKDLLKNISEKKETKEEN